MLETDEHYTLKYNGTCCFFPDINEWCYVSTVNRHNALAYTLIEFKKATDGAAVNVPTRSLVTVPYLTPPVGWRKLPQGGAVLLVRRINRTFKCGVSLGNTHIGYQNSITNTMTRDANSNLLVLLSALNLDSVVTEAEPGHYAVSRNFSMEPGGIIYWRDVEVGNLVFERTSLTISLLPAVEQEFKDQVNVEKYLEVHGFNPKTKILYETPNAEEKFV